MERRFRLRGEFEVREARAKGKAYADGPLVARVVANAIEPLQNRYAVIAGKRVGNAVQRNRTKRLVREALRKLHPTLRQGHDVVVIVRGTTADLTDLDVALASLERIARRAKLVEPSAVSNQPSVTTSSPVNLNEQSGAVIANVNDEEPSKKESLKG